ncbi:cysteine--tRNA ligase [uncultured Propionibacterium sp.]|uniref:cysteine--tRNA ligase n=1 Tax=uncultured Propionibacterium sp. TaxID=218066 RepID=UPI00292E8BBA|nr:cysteine--tRNA ligase [uncultured Propionibacterium sp.]
MSFKVYDESTGTTVPFAPLVEGRVSIYHCGLTVQGPPHLGHIRKEVVFDVLRRWFAASGYDVRVVANITDINEKIWARAGAAGIQWYELAYAVELELHRAYTALGCIPPDYEPRATGHIPEMIGLTRRLIDRGHAYAADDGSGDVYFDVRSWPEYGSLSNQRIEDMVSDESADERGKHDRRDFALWKGSKPGEPATASWPSPWGPGRPGWHLECSAMSLKYLGETFDIHGGGMDLRFPHHENEQAQSRAAGYGFARYWMHNAFVTMAGEKMSKSLGNGAIVTEVTRRFPPRAVRLYLAQPHYRSTIEYSENSLAEATAQVERIDSFLKRAGAADPVEFAFGDLPAAFVGAMDDDLGTPGAFAVLHETIKAGNRAIDSADGPAAARALRQVRAMLHVLGLDPHDTEWAGTGGADPSVLNELVQLVLAQRQAARARRDYAAADRIRDELTRIGVRIEDTPDGTRWSVSG